MDILAQVLLSAMIMLYGVILLGGFSLKINFLMSLGLGWFFGWAVASLSAIVLVMLGIAINLENLIIFSVLLLMCVLSLTIAKRREISSLNQQIIKTTLLILFTVCLTYLLAKYGNLIHYSPDSISYLGVSRVFHNYGWLETGDSFIFDQIFNSRLPFFVSIHNIAMLSQVNVYYIFFTATTIMLSMFIIGMWMRNTTAINWYSFLWLAFAFILFFTSKLMILHSFYLHTNLTAMAYFTVGALCLELHKEREESGWFLLASLFLGITCLTRKEMLIFSLLPFIFASCSRRPNFKIIFSGFVIYSLASYSWFFWGAFYFGDWKEVIDGALNIQGHGGLGIVLYTFPACIFTFFVLYRQLLYRHFNVVSIIAFFIFCCALVTLWLGDALLSPTRNLSLLLFTERGLWDNIWIIFLFFCGIWAGFTVACRNAGRTELDIASISIPLIIIAFFTLRVMLYAVFEGPEDTNWNHSGNRIILHIVPLCSYWMGLAGAEILNKVRSKMAPRIYL